MLKKANYKKLLADKVFFKQIFFENVLPMLLVRPDTLHILEVNQKAMDLLGFNKKEMLKKYIYEINPVKLQNKIKKQFENFKDKQYFSFELPIIKKSKEKILAEIRFNKFETNNAVVFVVSIYDMTERINLQNNIKDENHKLMDRTKELLQINRNLISSYEHLKKRFKDFQALQKQEISNERKSVINEMSEILKDKINVPLQKILDDLAKIKEHSDNLSKDTIKRLKMIEEIVENIQITVGRIAEERDIQRMRYIDLEGLE